VIRFDTQGFTMLAFATPFLAFALGAAAPTAHNADWLPASLDASCDLTDVDFSDRLHGFATCAFSDAMTTDDGGLTWTVFGTGLQQSLVFAHAVSTDELYAARLGLYHSTDRGAHWEELGGLSTAQNSMFDVWFGDSGHLVAILGGQILYSDDGGLHWDIGWDTVFGVDFDELHFTSVSIGYASGGITTGQGSFGSVLRTEDGGVHWTLLAFTHGEIMAADFFDDDHGIVATLSGEIYATADRGDTWQLIGPAPDAGVLLDIAHRDAAHWYAVSYQGCLYETHDTGVHWETGYCDPNANTLVAITLRGGAAIAGGNGGVVLFENRIFKDGLDLE
jgi:photosystem II stability/assembly factor-like uncharacterized protein